MSALRRLQWISFLFWAIIPTSAFAQQIIDTIPIGVQNFAVDQFRNKIYGATGYNGMNVIDGATDSVTFVQTGNGAFAVAANFITNKIYVVNSAPNTVTVVDGATLSTIDVTVGQSPGDVAVNTETNKIYVANSLGGSVTVIDGVTLATTTVLVPGGAIKVAVDSITNKIYVLEQSTGFITVIDGATNQTTRVQVGNGANAVVVNATANKIYTPNYLDNTVTIIDGATLATTTVAVGRYPFSLAVNEVTNKIYVVNQSIDDSVTVIDGATLSTVTVFVGNTPWSVAVNSATNKIYVTNTRSDSVSVIDGVTNSAWTVPVGTAPEAVIVNTMSNRVYVANWTDQTVSVLSGATTALQFVPISPCRLIDTRPPSGPGPIPGGEAWPFYLPLAGSCGQNLPPDVAAYSLNVTAAPIGPLHYLTIWPDGQPQPGVSLLNSLDGRTKANAVIVPFGNQGAVDVYVQDTSNVVIDINGYFTTAGTSTLQFYPLTPCRVVDTRDSGMPQGFGPPHLTANQERDFAVPLSSCIPQGVQPQAYSFNVTAVPYQGKAMGYLTVWPQGDPQPQVSTLNNPTATTVANAAIVPAGSAGAIAAFPSADTDFIVDINGYFASPGSGGLSFYPATPCRAFDTRSGAGAFQGKIVVSLQSSPCDLPASAQAYALNATVVPQPRLGYLTLWPDGENQPTVSTLNAADGWITSNMAIVPTNNGSIDAYASAMTQLILDVSGFFAP